MAKRWWSALSALLMIGCSSEATQPQVTADGGGTPRGDASDAGLACFDPDGPYGMTVGATFPRIRLVDCSNDGDLFLYGDRFCTAQVTVVSLAAGW
jgi:hypothetical protein